MSEVPQFIQHDPPEPRAPQPIDPRQQKPLNKLINRMWKGRNRDPFHSRARTKKKLKNVKFY